MGNTRAVAAVVCLTAFAVGVVGSVPGGPASAQIPGGVPGIPPGSPSVPSEPTRLPEPLNSVLPPSVVISDATVLESAGIATLTLTLDRQDPRPMRVRYSTSDGSAAAGTATAPGDYQMTVGAVTFAPLSTQTTVTVQVNNDQQPEPEEVFFVDILPTSEPVVADGRGAVYIKDNDGAQEGISISDSSVPEGNSGLTDLNFTVTLSSPVDRPVSVNYATKDGTAHAGEDYQFGSGTLIFSPGQTTRVLSVAVTGDETVEVNEDFRVELSEAQNARLVDPLAAAVIVNDDKQAIDIKGMSVKEGDPRPVQTLAYTVSLKKPHSDVQAVTVITSDGTAGANSDYEPRNTLITFPPGAVEQQVPVRIIRDRVVETNEWFRARLSAASGGATMGPDATGTVLNDDYTISANSVSVPEGNTGSTDAVVTVSVSEADEVPVSVRYKTLDGDAKDQEDFQPASGEVVFSPWEKSKQVAVKVNGDLVPEGDEVFSLHLSQPNNAILDNPGGGKVTIADDDGYVGSSPTVLDELALPIGTPQGPGKGRVFVSGLNSDSDAVAPTGPMLGAQRIVRAAVRYATNGRPAPRILFVVFPRVDSRSRAGMQASGFMQCSPQVVSAPLPAVACWDAAGPPYPERQPTDDPLQLDLRTVDFGNYDVVVVGGMISGSYQREWDVLIDRKTELCEYVNGGGGLVAFAEISWVSNSSPNAPLVPAPGIGPVFGFLPGLVVEPYVYDSSIAALKPTPAGKRLGITDSDYYPGSRSSTWSNVHDYFPQNAGWEAFTVDAAGRPITIGTDRGLDCAHPESPGVSVMDGRDYEGDRGTSTLKMGVTLRARSPRLSTVDYTITGATATAGKDFMYPLGGPILGRGKLVFQPGEVLKTIDVPVVGDVEVEANETFNVVLHNPVNVSINNAQATGTILNDDFLPGQERLGDPDGSGSLSRETTGGELGPGGPANSAAQQSTTSPSSAASHLTQPIQGQASVSQQQAQEAGAQQTQTQAQGQSGFQQQSAAQISSQTLGAMTLNKERESQIQKVPLGGGGAHEGEYLAASRVSAPPAASAALLVLATLAGCLVALANQPKGPSRRVAVTRAVPVKAGRGGNSKRADIRRRRRR